MPRPAAREQRHNQLAQFTCHAVNKPPAVPATAVTYVSSMGLQVRPVVQFSCSGNQVADLVPVQNLFPVSASLMTVFVYLVPVPLSRRAGFVPQFTSCFFSISL